MGRRNEKNRLEHKKKVDAKRSRESNAKLTLKEKKRAILEMYKQQISKESE